MEDRNFFSCPAFHEAWMVTDVMIQRLVEHLANFAWLSWIVVEEIDWLPKNSVNPVSWILQNLFSLRIELRYPTCPVHCDNAVRRAGDKFLSKVNLFLKPVHKLSALNSKHCCLGEDS